MKTIHRYDLGVTGWTARKYLNPGEQDVLLTLIKDAAPRIMVEIGVNEGLTAQAVLRECSTIERYIGIDVDADYEFEISAQQIERPDQPGRLVRHDPRFHLVLRGAPMPLEADVVFIDGDHGKDAVLADSIWAATVVRRGGLIIWHDYNHAAVEVTDVLDKLGQDRELYHVLGTWLVFEQR